MTRSPSDDLFRHYKGLIGYAANLYATRSHIIDPEDLFQDGCLMMLEFFDGRVNVEDKMVHNTFKKSLFLWMKRTVERRIKQARPGKTSVVRLNGNGLVDIPTEDSCVGVDVDIDRMLATYDTCVLAKLYAEEFVVELRRLLKGLDLIIFDLLVRSMENGDRCVDVVRRVIIETGTCDSNVYGRIQVIRNMATNVLLRSA